jgi:hypothetical protein
MRAVGSADDGARPSADNGAHGPGYDGSRHSPGCSAAARAVEAGREPEHQSGGGYHAHDRTHSNISLRRSPLLKPLELSDVPSRRRPSGSAEMPRSIPQLRLTWPTSFISSAT